MSVIGVAPMCYLQQEVPEGDEGGPVFGFGAPALQHDVVDVLGTVLRFAQPLGLHVYFVEDLQRDKDEEHSEEAGDLDPARGIVGADLAPIEAQPRVLPVGEHLPQGDPEHPGIGGVREGTRLQRLWRTPGGHVVHKATPGPFESPVQIDSHLTRGRGFCGPPP